MKFGLKWVHMARYELILRLDGALWLTIIFKPLLTPKRAFTIQFESYFWMFVTENVSMIWNVRLDVEIRPKWILPVCAPTRGVVAGYAFSLAHPHMSLRIIAKFKY